MCTAATYKTRDFYFGRTLDYEFSYGDEITITPRNYPFHFRHAWSDRYALMRSSAWHMLRRIIRCITMPSTRKGLAWQD